MKNERRPADVLIERLALGELGDDEARLVREQLGAAADETLAALERSSAAILTQTPPGAFVAEVKRRQARAKRVPANRTVSPLLWAPGLAAIALVGWLARPGRPVIPVGLDDEVRFKGLAPGVTIYRQNKDGVPVELSEGSSGRAGDLLQIRYVTASARHGVILSIDGRGQVSLHWPAQETGPTLLTLGGGTLPRAFELDDAPGFERFFFITTSDGHALSTATVLEAAHRLAADPQAARKRALPLDPSLQQSFLLLTKVAR